MSNADDDAVIAVLERSRRLGFLGPGSVRVHAEHALGFAAGLPSPPARFIDLGSGGGVPGLVLALHWATSLAVLLDVSERRCAFLTEVVPELGLESRVTVVRDRAEVAGRRPDLRAQFDLVVARGFGRPPVTAECGAPFLTPGGRLVVSEPPDHAEDASADRWPPEGLVRVGLVAAGVWNAPYRYRSFALEHPCPETYPRRVGVPARRPLF